MPPLREVETLLNLCINSLRYVICQEALRVAGVKIICPFIELSLNLSSGSLQSDINCGFVNIISGK